MQAIWQRGLHNRVELYSGLTAWKPNIQQNKAKRNSWDGQRSKFHDYLIINFLVRP